jgi:hypothetical protein
MSKTKLHQRRRNHLLYLVGTAFLVSALAFFNRYPLVYSDTGTYIRSAFTLHPPVDRPIGYSLIIRAVTWQSTLWTVVLFQGLMISWLLWETMRKVLPQSFSLWRAHLSIILFLVLTTSLSWCASQIMPDIFTPMVVLVVFLLFSAPELGLVKRAFLWTCLFFFLITHNSHVAMAALMLVGMALVKLFRSGWRAWPHFWPNLAGMVLVLAAGIAFIIGYNARNGLRPVFAPAAHVFLAARLCENALLSDFLAEHCGEGHYRLCAYREELPSVPVEFIWGEGSPLIKIAPDLAAADTVLAPMVHDVFSNPEFLGRFLRSSMVSSVVQLFQVSAGSSLSPYEKGSPPYREVAEKLPWELSSYNASAQAEGAWWNLGFPNRVFRVVTFISVILLVWFWPQWRCKAQLRDLVTMLLAWVVLNAVITASLANVYDRLQSRVTWLVVLAACLALAQAAHERWLPLGTPRPRETE